MTTERLEAFSDGVFAIAVTLLILEVRVPEGGGSLGHLLAQAWPDYVAYVISFVTIGIMWANHHAIFRLVASTGHGLVVANLFLLLAVSFLPFPTKVLGEQLRHAGADQTAATMFYNASFVVVAVFFNLVWLLARRADTFVSGTEEAVAHITSRYRLGVPSYLLATVAALWSVPLSLAIDGGLALLYIALPGTAATSAAAGTDQPSSGA